jgi:mono/diheme cytochrome c family protein
MIVAPERRSLAIAVGIAMTGVLCGCAAQTHERTAAQRSVGSTFAAACSACHTLTGHNTATAGGDLAIADLSTRVIASFIRVMPVHLSTGEIDDVARYVHDRAAARKRP